MSQLSPLYRIGVSVLACLALATTGQADAGDTITVSTVNSQTVNAGTTNSTIVNSDLVNTYQLNATSGNVGTLNVTDLNVSGDVTLETFGVTVDELEYEGADISGVSGIDVEGDGASLRVDDSEASLLVEDQADTGENGILVTPTQTVIRGGTGAIPPGLQLGTEKDLVFTPRREPLKAQPLVMR